MLKYNVEIVLAQQEISKTPQSRYLEVFDISLEDALRYVKRIVEQDSVIDARILDETGRQIKLPNF